MAKGVHSKRRKRNQSIKRKILDEKLWRPRLEETSKRLFKRTFGRGDDSVMTLKKNAFRFPNDPEAEIPQRELPVYIDRRTINANRSYLAKEMGTKKKNLLKKAHQESLAAALKQAEERAEGKIRENEVIDLNNVVKYDEYGNIDVDQIDMGKFNIDDKKSRRNTRSSGMDVEDGDHHKVTATKNQKRSSKRKNKSFYIVNY